MFVLDTDYISILKRESGKEFDRLVRRLEAFPEEDFFISIISFHEQVRGWQSYIAKATDEGGVVRGYEELEKLLHDYAQAQVLPYDEAAAELFDDLRRRKTRVGTMDLRIAAIAMTNNLTLLTRNTVDFERVPGLAFEDWI